MRNAAQLRIHVLAVAGYAPPWASGHLDSDKYPPTDPRDYATFVKAIADRYGPGGRFWRANPRLTPSPLTAIELWNEPWHVGFWGPGPDPAAYARLVRTATTAVKPAHPRIALLASADVSGSGGGPGSRRSWPPTPALWRSRLVDGWSVHLYCQERSPWDATSQPQFRFDRVLVTRQPRPSRRAPASRSGSPSSVGAACPESPDAVSEEAQAQYEHDGLVRATTEWALVRAAQLRLHADEAVERGAVQPHPPGWVCTAGLVLDPGVHSRDRKLIPGTGFRTDDLDRRSGPGHVGRGAAGPRSPSRKPR